MAIKNALFWERNHPNKKRNSSPCLGGRIPRPDGNHGCRTIYTKNTKEQHFQMAINKKTQMQSRNHQTHTKGKLPLPTFPIDNILRGDAPAPWAVFRSLGGRFMSTLRNALLCWTEMAPVGSPEHAPN